MLISDYDYNDSGMIKRIIAGKFKKESITDSEKAEAVCIAFANDVGNIINVISNNEVIVGDYLQKTFGVLEN